MSDEEEEEEEDSEDERIALPPKKSKVKQKNVRLLHCCHYHVRVFSA